MVQFGLYKDIVRFIPEQFMTLNYFKDLLFDIINETDTIPIRDIVVDDDANTFTIETLDGCTFLLFLNKK